MACGLLMHMLTFFLALFTSLGIKDSNKDLEIILLRQQMRIYQRKGKTSPRNSDPERMMLATLANKLRPFSEEARQNLHQVLLVFKPDMVPGWHRNLVRCKGSFQRKGKPGRPGYSCELEALIVRLVKENPRWGYGRIQGELLRLGYRLGATSCAISSRDIESLRYPNGPRVPGAALLRQMRDLIRACDFFTVETIWLRTIYVLFFIELGTRRIHLAGCTTNPNKIRVSQQARQLVWDLKDKDRDRMIFLIHDKDTKFITSFDNVFSSARLRSFIPLIKLKGRMRLQNDGCGRFGKSIWILSWS